MALLRHRRPRSRWYCCRTKSRSARRPSALRSSARIKAWRCALESYRPVSNHC